MHMASSQVWQRTHRTYISTSLHVRMQSTDLTLIQVHLSHIPGVPSPIGGNMNRTSTIPLGLRAISR